LQHPRVGEIPQLKRPSLPLPPLTPRCKNCTGGQAHQGQGTTLRGEPHRSWKHPSAPSTQHSGTTAAHNQRQQPTELATAAAPSSSCSPHHLATAAAHKQQQQPALPCHRRRTQAATAARITLPPPPNPASAAACLTLPQPSLDDTRHQPVAVGCLHHSHHLPTTTTLTTCDGGGEGGPELRQLPYHSTEAIARAHRH
jgi:hypothetical protein